MATNMRKMCVFGMLLLMFAVVCRGTNEDTTSETENISAVIESVLSDDSFLEKHPKIDIKIEPEVPTLEHVKIIRPNTDLIQITPKDIQQFLADEEFSADLLVSEQIPEAVKEFFRTQRSPVLEAVVPINAYKPIGSSRALTLKELLLGVENIDLENQEYSFISNIDDEDFVDRQKRKVKCVPRNMTQDSEVPPTVTILNSTELLDRLGSKNETNNHCAVVLFYAPWCVFSARAAPHFNALARVFPQLDVFAINAAHFSKFGTVAVPNILVFHNAKAVARFNNSERILENIATFVTNITGLSGNISVQIEEEDYIGPLPSQATEDPDYLLWLSWLFLISFSSYMFSKSTVGLNLLEYIGHLGHIEHQHIE